MIDTVIFDIGDVLAKFRWKEYIEELGYSKETREGIAKATVLSKWWVENDRGMAKEEYERHMIEEAPWLEEEIKDFFSHTIRIQKEYPYAAPLIHTLKENGYKVYLLSNYGDFLFNQAKETWSFLKDTDGRVVSYEVGRLKPEPDIYEILFERYQIDPGHAVFLDDNEANIEGAREVGLTAIHFQGINKAVEELRGYGVRI